MSKLETISGKEGRKLAKDAVRAFLEKNPQPGQSGKENIADPSDEVFRLKAIFPLQLFPDELIIYPNIINYVINTGPGVKTTRDLYIRDISQVQANAGILFGRLRIISKLQTEEPITLDRVKTSDVIKAREIIQDLRNEMQKWDERRKSSIY